MIFEQLRELIAEKFAVSMDIIDENTSITEDLEADSLDLVELALALEDEFNVPEICDRDIMRLVTVGDIESYLKTAMK